MNLSSTASEGRPLPKRVTLIDVAAHAGVSRATASRVLRGIGTVPEATVQRVRGSMDALGYVYHRGAAALRANRTQSVGVVVPDMMNGFTAALSMAAEAVLAESGVVTMVANSLESTQRQELLVRSMVERQVDGILIIPSSGSTPVFVDTLAASGIPTVMTTREWRHPRVPYVGIDNVMGGRSVAEHLVHVHGRREIAYIGGYADLPPRIGRIEGILDVLSVAGAPSVLALDLPGAPDGATGYRVVQQLAADDELPEGIVCHNDAVAFGVSAALRHAGVTPAAVPVVSYDDMDEASFWDPPLTTLAASGNKVGRRAGEVLLRRIADPRGDVERVLLSSELVVRRSCGCS